jgi:hypothetical protein
VFISQYTRRIFVSSLVYFNSAVRRDNQAEMRSCSPENAIPEVLALAVSVEEVADEAAVIVNHAIADDMPDQGNAEHRCLSHHLEVRRTDAMEVVVRLVTANVRFAVMCTSGTRISCHICGKGNRACSTTKPSQLYNSVSRMFTLQVR